MREPVSSDSAQADDQAPSGARNSAPVPTSASRRVRARLARRITAGRSAAVKPVLEPLVSLHRELYPKADLTLLQRAYDVADELHSTQMRKSG
ncbi:MAG: GTP pyrophosphokinase, partial [Actinobacteria bacterium]|nr:GTP pyrophosphokinase [Actinomycetota bacterium]